MTGLYTTALHRISKMRNKTDIHDEIIRFPDVFEELCRSYQIPKTEAWEILFLLRDFGFVDVIRFQGIKVNQKKCKKVGL